MGGKISSNKGFKPGFCGVLFRATKSLKNVFQFLIVYTILCFGEGLSNQDFFLSKALTLKAKFVCEALQV